MSQQPDLKAGEKSHIALLHSLTLFQSPLGWFYSICEMQFDLYLFLDGLQFLYLHNDTNHIHFPGLLQRCPVNALRHAVWPLLCAREWSVNLRQWWQEAHFSDSLVMFFIDSFDIELPHNERKREREKKSLCVTSIPEPPGQGRSVLRVSWPPRSWVQTA